MTKKEKEALQLKQEEEKKYMDTVLEMTLVYFPGISKREVLSKSRKQELVKARALAGYMMYFHRNSISMYPIGKYFNRCGHDAVCHFIKVVNTMIGYDRRVTKAHKAMSLKMKCKFGPPRGKKREIHESYSKGQSFVLTENFV